MDFFYPIITEKLRQYIQRLEEEEYPNLGHTTLLKNLPQYIQRLEGEVWSHPASQLH